MEKPLKTKAELINYIKRKRIAAVEGSNTLSGFNYHEIPFPGYEALNIHRMDSASRIEAIRNNINLSGLRVLDIGCNSGYFTFEAVRLGARECVGIDYDEDAIFIANSLKNIHKIENVHFACLKFDKDFPGVINETYGSFDVLILNSIVHWLIYGNLTYNRVINLLNQLKNDGKQIIIYEPSSSRSAYYPELLKKKGIVAFFNDLGVMFCEKIGESRAANVNDTRQLWVGEKDIKSIATRISRFLEQTPQAGLGDKFDEYKISHLNRDKICFLGRNFFIKTTITANSLFSIFLENEYRYAIQLNTSTINAVIMVGRTEVAGRQFLFYKPVKNKSITNSFLSKSDTGWISKELFVFLNNLQLQGLVHNDLKPQNILPDKRNRSLTVIDYEFCGKGSSFRERKDDPWLPFPCRSDEEKALVVRLMELVGGSYRSPHGPGCFENDLYAINTIIYEIKNRKKYRQIWLSMIKNRLKRGIKYLLGNFFFITRYKIR